MDFIDQLKQFASRLEKTKDNTAHPEIIKESFVDLLKKINIPNPENLIEISNIPLRV